MKAIVINRQPASPVEMLPSVAIIPSSAMVSDGKPLFRASWSPQWSVTPAVAFRLSRLGKAISAGFAHRYYDAAQAVLLVRPAAAARRPDLQGLEYAADGALVTGSRQPLSPDGSYTLTLGPDDAMPSLTLSAADIALDRVIEALSSFMTLQMGDLLIACVPPLEIPIEIGGRLSVALNSPQPSLSVRIR